MAVGGIEPVSHELPGNIELWRVDLDQYRYGPEAAIFSADERKRAERLRFADDRRRFLAAHHALRHVLGRALKREPGALAFESGAHGKPRLLDAGGLEFNLSHSVHQCLIGTSTQQPIGVDVEVLHPVVDAEALARRHFTQDEFEQWEQAPAADRDRVFLQGWTRKEACLKALGVGLLSPPQSIELGCDGGVRQVVVESGSSRAVVELASIDLGDAAIGAVARAVAAA
jgi:4'-phosphopantetheinyl transferase